MSRRFNPGLLAGNAELLEERTFLEVGLPLVIGSEEPAASQEALLALRGQMKPANVVEARRRAAAIISAKPKNNYLCSRAIPHTVQL